MKAYNEEFGPDQALADTIGNHGPAEQAALYEELTLLYKLTDKLERGCDYFKLTSINGVDYYDPNNEEWGAIVALSHEHKLALYTGFYEMDDMGNPDSGYAMVVHKGMLDCEWKSDEH